MLKFLVYDDGRPATEMSLRTAHLVGTDNIGVRSTIRFADGMIQCEKRASGPAALVLPVDTGELGRLTLQTCLLPERDEPYLLSVELARHRLMTIVTKEEDWDLTHLAGDWPAMRRLASARSKFVQALTDADKPEVAEPLGKQALVAAVDASEELAIFHANNAYEARRREGHLPRRVFGCGVDLGQRSLPILNGVRANFDFIRVPTTWKRLEPQEQQCDWTDLDAWVRWAVQQRVPVLAGPLLSFRPPDVPEWLYVWEHDYDTLRDLVYEHVERVVARYRNAVSLWNVVSGIHVNETFPFNFEQLMDLTRMAVMLTKKIQPNGRTLIELTQPFGEYYAFHQASIPPLMYAEMVLQSGIPFDGFGVKLVMGNGAGGGHTRDLMQASALLDALVNLGKPIHVTGVAVPSQQAESAAAADDGYWRKPWSPTVQSHWLEAFYSILLGKPNVESIAWVDLTDRPDGEVPYGGLVAENLEPKPALRRLATMRKSLQEPGEEAAGARPTP